MYKNRAKIPTYLTFLGKKDLGYLFWVKKPNPLCAHAPMKNGHWHFVEYVTYDQPDPMGRWACVI